MLARLTLALTLPLLSACASSHRHVEFRGRSAPPLSPARVVEAPALPRTVTPLGSLTARCEVPPAGAFTERALIDVDCTLDRLKLWLREAAAERGGDVLAALVCEGARTKQCRATLARTGAARPLTTDARVAERSGASILISYAPSVAHLDRPAQPASLVRELQIPTPELVITGQLEASCEHCAETTLRSGVLVAAGRVGAAAVVAVRCLRTGDGWRCVGEAATTEFPIERQARR